MYPIFQGWHWSPLTEKMALLILIVIQIFVPLCCEIHFLDINSMKHGCTMAKLDAMELRMFTESSSHFFELLALLLLLSCFNYNRATLLAFLRHFVCVCESVGGVLERPYQIGNGQSCGRWSVQTLGACTKPSQNSRFISPDNTHTGTDTERQTPREFSRTSL